MQMIDLKILKSEELHLMGTSGVSELQIFNRQTTLHTEDVGFERHEQLIGRGGLMKEAIVLLYRKCKSQCFLSLTHARD